MWIENSIFNSTSMPSPREHLILSLEAVEHASDTIITPSIYLKSADNKYKYANSSMFTFNYAEVQQFMPEITFQNDCFTKPDPDPDLTLPGGEKSEVLTDPSKVTPGSMKEHRIRGRLLSRATEVLNKLFTGAELNLVDSKLESYEFKLVKTILLKKFSRNRICFNSDTQDTDAEEFFEMAQRLYGAHKSHKRREENTKFVFKNTLKSLKKRFFDSNNLANDYERELKFFQSYFSVTSSERNLLIDVFFDPLNTSHQFNPHYRTLNKNYLGLLFSNSQFKDEFMNYVDKFFLEDYHNKILRKFNKMFKRLRKKMRVEGEEQYPVVIDIFTQKMVSNKRCKLPWIRVEVLEAISHFKKVISSLQKEEVD